MDQRRVGIVGDGPAAAAVENALADVDARSDRIGPGEIDEVTLGIVVSDAADERFGVANETGADRWIAVELGGIGGYALDGVEAAVSVLGRTGCFGCLRSRVAANHDAADGTPGTTPPDARLAGATAGRLAVAALGGEDVQGHVVEVPHAERRLLPVPGCACDGKHDYRPRRSFAAIDLDEAASRFERTVDDRLGIVAELGEVHSFPAPYYLASLCDTGELGDANADRHAAGVARGWDGAFVKAVGEALERYGAALYREERFQTTTVAELDDAVSPEVFVRPDEGYETPGDDDGIPWVRGEDLHSGEAVHLPAEFVHFPPPERRYKPPITSGLGLGSSGADALLAGLYEVVERDATMLAWYSTFEPLELRIEADGFETLTRRAGSEGLSVTPLLVTQDVDVPVVSVAVHREAEWPRFAVGSAADLDPNGAAENALCEALQNWMELRDMGEERAAEEETAIGRYAGFPREARSFLDVDGAIDASSLAHDADLAGEEEVLAVLDRLDDAGLSAYASRLTPRDIEEMGFEAVRVLIPAAQPLLMSERFFGERARRVPRELGYRSRLDRPSHPYP